MGQLILIVLGVVLAVIVGIWILGKLLSLAFSLMLPLLLVAVGVGIGIWLAGRRSAKHRAS